MYDGILGMYLLNKIDEDEEVIDMRTVNKGTNLNVFKVRQNLNQFLAGCSGRIQLVNVGAQNFLDKNPTMCLGVIWQIIRLVATKKIKLKDCEGISSLLMEGEDIKDLLKLSPEEILKRWMNFHLKNAGQPVITNLGGDLKDSKKLLYVMN